MDVGGHGVDGRWEMPRDRGALVFDMTDAASVAILATMAATLGLHTDNELQRAVRTWYRALTQPGTVDGPLTLTSEERPV